MPTLTRILVYFPYPIGMGAAACGFSPPGAQDNLYGSPLGQPELKSDGRRRFQKCHVFVSALAEKSDVRILSKVICF